MLLDFKSLRRWACVGETEAHFHFRMNEGDALGPWDVLITSCQENGPTLHHLHPTLRGIIHIGVIPAWA